MDSKAVNNTLLRKHWCIDSDPDLILTKRSNTTRLRLDESIDLKRMEQSDTRATAVYLVIGLGGGGGGEGGGEEEEVEKESDDGSHLARRIESDGI